MAFEVDCVVIGAGVVGIAVARRLQLSGREVFLIERQSAFGTETSSRNSEVVHAGIYYAPGSLKATLCVRGKQLLYEYCAQRNVPFKRVGKIIVAVDDNEVASLEGYKFNAEANGVNDLAWLCQSEVKALEPKILAVRGLYSPSTGILDSHSFMQSLLDDFEQAGGMFIRRSPVLGGEVTPKGIQLDLGDQERTIIMARSVVNSAGLYAPDVARSIRGFPLPLVPKPGYAIGHYFTLAGSQPFRHLVYPIARAGGLGIHVTLDLGGGVRFGPDISWRDTVDYTFDADSRRAPFADAIRRYYPDLLDEQLQAGYTGIRPKIIESDSSTTDFIIQGKTCHGIDGLVNLFGIESPGLTSSLAIAENVSIQLSS